MDICRGSMIPGFRSRVNDLNPQTPEPYTGIQPKSELFHPVAASLQIHLAKEAATFLDEYNTKKYAKEAQDRAKELAKKSLASSSSRTHALDTRFFNMRTHNDEPAVRTIRVKKEVRPATLKRKVVHAVPALHKCCNGGHCRQPSCFPTKTGKVAKLTVLNSPLRPKQSGQKIRTTLCVKCLKYGHYHTNCWADKVCALCLVVGHVESVCRLSKEGSSCYDDNGPHGNGQNQQPPHGGSQAMSAK